MQAIVLDEKQTSVVAQSPESVQVCDQAGTLLGHIVPNGAGNSWLEEDHWIECWHEWYSETDEQESEQPETD